MNSKRHSRLRRHQLIGTPRALRRLQRHIADIVVDEIMKEIGPELSRMFCGEASGGPRRPGVYFVGREGSELFLPRALTAGSAVGPLVVPPTSG